eukprot:XP_001705637.1 Hypothetical protein GL50803_15223 [Giardia lamblia ATCC 50803]
MVSPHVLRAPLLWPVVHPVPQVPLTPSLSYLSALPVGHSVQSLAVPALHVLQLS